ncbi:MAG: broad specificity phosphatase PhoE [Chlamydiales bacterium]|jgi:broad specificity phosphatase PhoE
MKCHIYIIRHGSTDWNQEFVIQGRQNPHLSNQGMREASEAAEKLTELALKKIYTSPLFRTTETGNIIGSALGVAVEASDELGPRNYGEWEGKKCDTIREEYSHVFRKLAISTMKSRFEDRPLEDIESYEEIANRVNTLIHNLGDELEDGDNVLFVTHGGIISSLLLQCDQEAYNDIPLLAQDGCALFQYQNGNISLEKITGLNAPRTGSNEEVRTVSF